VIFGTRQTISILMRSASDATEKCVITELIYETFELIFGEYNIIPH
jgi:hypothetical protein